MDLKKLVSASMSFDKILRSCVEGLLTHQEKIDNKIIEIEKRLGKISNTLGELSFDNNNNINKNEFDEIIKDNNKSFGNLSIYEQISEIIDRDNNNEQKKLLSIISHDENSIDNDKNKHNIIKNTVLNKRINVEDIDDLDIEELDELNEINKNITDKKNDDGENKDINNKLNLNKGNEKIIIKKEIVNNDRLNETNNKIVKQTSNSIIPQNNYENSNNNEINDNNDNNDNKLLNLDIKKSSFKINKTNKKSSIKLSHFDNNIYNNNEDIINNNSNSNYNIQENSGSKKASQVNINLKTNNLNQEDIEENFNQLKSTTDKTNKKLLILNNSFNEIKIYLKSQKNKIFDIEDMLKSINTGVLKAKETVYNDKKEIKNAKINITDKPEDFDFKAKLLRLEKSNKLILNKLNLTNDVNINIDTNNNNNNNNAKEDLSISSPMNAQIKNMDKRIHNDITILHNKIEDINNYLFKDEEFNSKLNIEIKKQVDEVNTKIDAIRSSFEAKQEELRNNLNTLKDQGNFDKSLNKSKDYQATKFNVDQIRMNFSHMKDLIHNNSNSNNNENNNSNNKHRNSLISRESISNNPNNSVNNNINSSVINNNTQHSSFNQENNDNKKDKNYVLSKKISELEKKLLTYIQTSNIETINKDIKSLKISMKDCTKVDETQDLYNRHTLLNNTVNQFKEEYTNYISSIKYQDDINNIKKKIEIMNAIINKMRLDDREKDKPVVDISHLLEASEFQEYKSFINEEQKKIFLKLIDVEDDIEKYHNEFIDIKDEVKLFNLVIEKTNKRIEKVQLRLPIDYVTSKEFISKMKIIDTQIKNLVSSYIKSMEKGEAWILSKNKLHTVNCASCEKILENGLIKNEPDSIKADYNIMNKRNKLGYGYSKKLKSLDMSRINNPDLAKSHNVDIRNGKKLMNEFISNNPNNIKNSYINNTNLNNVVSINNKVFENSSVSIIGNALNNSFANENGLNRNINDKNIVLNNASENLSLGNNNNNILQIKLSSDINSNTNILTDNNHLFSNESIGNDLMNNINSNVMNKSIEKIDRLEPMANNENM